MAGLALSFSNVSSLGEVDCFFQSPWLKVQMDDAYPRFTFFSTDSLGKRDFYVNPLLPVEKQGGYTIRRNHVNKTISYFKKETSQELPQWQFHFQQKGFTITSHAVAGAAPFTIDIAQKKNHATVLGIMEKQREMSMPCILHFPGLGSFRITCNKNLQLHYDASRNVPEPFISLGFPAATIETGTLIYTFESVAIYPDLPRIRNKPVFDGFKKNYINIFQMNPEIYCLANNSASDACTFTLYSYAEMARRTPPLAKGLQAHDLIRTSLDRYFSGMKGYGEVGYGFGGWASEYDSTDSMPSLIIAACYYVADTKDDLWARQHYHHIKSRVEKMMSTDNTGNGLIKYGYSGNSGSWAEKFKRPANWWDSIGFGHEDAYSNVLCYRALTLVATLATQLGYSADGRQYAAKAARLKKTFWQTFYNPATGVLAGWKSADGELHDYYFVFVNTMAITYGLVDVATGKKLMQSILDKMKDVGYKDFTLGIPGNLIPIKGDDYSHHDPRWGYQRFEVYENGGASGNYAYFFIRALQLCGLKKEADDILLQMMKAYTQRSFQGNCPGSEYTKDWKTWKGECWGYEGFLVDNYLTFLAVYNY